MSDLTKRMNRIGKAYASQQNTKRARKALKQYKENEEYEKQAARRKQNEALAKSRKLAKAAQSDAGKALTGVVYGFNTNMAPLSYSKKASDLGYDAYTPTAAAAERGDTTQETADFNKKLESSKAYRFGNLAGNVGATALTFLMGAPLTKAAAGKVLGTKAAKKLTGTAAEKLTQKAITDTAKKSIRSKIVNRVAQRYGGKLTETALRNASEEVVDKVATNVAQDVAGDMTIGLYRDLATARSQDVDVKDVKQLAPYLGKQALWNTAIGAVTNGAVPISGMMKKNKAAWRTVERIGDDGIVHKVQEYVPTVNNKAVRTVTGDASDLLSRRLKGGRQTVNGSAQNLKMSDLHNAVHDTYFVDTIRHKGINGKSVRQAAAEQHKSVSDVIADEYRRTNGTASDKINASRRAAMSRDELSPVEISGAQGKTVTVKNRGLKSAYDAADPNARIITRTEDGRRILHRATGNDYIKADNIRRGVAQTADEAVATTAKQTDGIKYRDDYVPKHDIEDLNYARQLDEGHAEKHMKQKYGMDSFEYAKQNNMQRSAVIRMAKDEIAEDLGIRELSSAERKAWADDLIGANIATKQATAEASTAEAAAKQTAEPTPTPQAQTVQATAEPSVTAKQTAQNVPDTNTQTVKQAEQAVPNAGTQTVQSTTTTSQAATKQATQATQAAISATGTTPDITMGGNRTGVKSNEQSQTVDTIIKRATKRGNSEEEVKKMKEALDESGFSKKFSHSNEDLINEATERIQRDNGLEQTTAELRGKYDADARWTDVDAVAAEAAESRYDEIRKVALSMGDSDLAEQAAKYRDELNEMIAAEGNEAGKLLQARKAFGRLTAKGRVNSAYKLKAKLEKKFGIKNMKMDNQLVDMLHDAKNADDLQYIQDQIAINLWDQVPPTLTEKLAAWRYISMLANPKTHIRNIFGNTVFKLPRAVSNTLGAMGESALLKEGDKTKAIINPFSKSDKMLVNKGWQEWDRVKSTFMNGTTKYKESMSRVEGSKVFKSKILQKLSDWNAFLLNKEDEYFAKRAYASAYAQYLKANKIDLATASQDVLDAARKNAWDNALTSTYREANALADLYNSGRKGANISLRDIKNAKDSTQAARMVGEKMWGTALDTVVPFVKTPANILKEGVYYSPAGFVRAGSKILKAAKTGDPKDTVKAIGALAEATTGTGIFAFGAWMAHQKMATASIDLDDKGYYDYDRGMQEYSITIGNETLKKADWFDVLNSSSGNDVNITADSTAPAAMAFFSGVETYNSFFGGGTDDSIADKATKVSNFFANVLKMSDPVFDMSMLSSLKNALDTSSDEDSGAVTKVLVNAVQSRAGQYIPTALSQVTKTLDKGQRSQESAQTGAVKTWDKFLKQQQNKIPGLAQKNPLKRDVFGNVKEEKTETKNYVQSALKNMLSPTNIKQVRNTGVDKELNTLIDKGMPEDSILPDRKSVNQIQSNVDGLKLKIGTEEMVKYNEIRGKEALKQLTKLFESKAYKDESNEGKVDLIKQAYSDATKYADKEFAMSQGISEYDYEYKTMSKSNREKYNEKLAKMKKLGKPMNKKAYMKVFTEAYNYGSDVTDKDRSVAKVLRGVEIKNGVRSYEQAAVALGAYKSTWKKAVWLHDNGYTSKDALRLTLTDEEKDRCSTTKSTSDPTRDSTQLDQRKLILYINSKNISREEKRAMYEVNRYYYSSWNNPF